MTEPAPTLEFVNVRKAFKGLEVLQDVSMSVRTGEVICICGENGVGKSTLFDVANGRLRPDSGQVFYKGQRIDRMSPARIAKRGVGRLLQWKGIFGTLAAVDNVAVGKPNQRGESWWAAPFWPALGREEERRVTEDSLELMQCFNIDGYARIAGSDLSGGCQRLVTLLRLLNSGADCLLMDEPTAGVNRSLFTLMIKQIRQAAGDGAAVIIVEHERDLVQQLADRILILSDGRLHEEPTPRTPRGVFTT